MLLDVGSVRRLGTPDDPRLAFREGPKEEGDWAGDRLLYLDDEPAYRLANWCGTCPVLFRRLEGAIDTASLDDLAARLLDGLDVVDDAVVDRFGDLLQEGEHLPLLLQVTPRLTVPVLAGDYFAEEQAETWGIERFWDLPEYPRTPYYRTFETAVEATGHFFEFVVPMVPPSWNDPERVRELEEVLERSDRPTAVAVSILDVRQPAMPGAGDYYAHWTLTHFLLDGHHKMQAAARTGRPLRLLSLLALHACLPGPEMLDRVVELRSRPPAARER